MASISTLPTEIIESILSFLPTKDLLLSQRTRRLWRDLVKRSELLQQALFLKPEKPRLVARYVNICRDGQLDRETYSLVPATQADVDGRYERTGSDNTCWYQESRMLVGRFNPLAITRLHDPGYYIEDTPAVYWNIACGRTPIILISPPRPQGLEQFAVWRKMLLTQPPACVVEYGWKFQVPRQGCLRTDSDQYPESSPVMKYGAVENKAGVTMGEVLDRIKALEEETQGRFEYSLDSKTVVVGVIDLTADEKLGLRSSTGNIGSDPADELDIDSL